MWNYWGEKSFTLEKIICSVPVLWNLSSWTGVVLFGLNPQKEESKQWSLGAGSWTRLCVCSSFWICSGLLRASFRSLLSHCREVTLSAILCFLLQVLCSVFMDFIYIYPICKMICAECLSVRGCVVGCLQAVGIAHLSIQTGFSPFLISRQTFLIIEGKRCQMSFSFSHQQLFIFALSTSILFMLQVRSVLDSHIRLLICLNWELKTSCSLAGLSAQGLE